MNLETQIKSIVESFGATLYDIELVREGTRNIYQVFITTSDGVSVELCAKISRTLSPLLDVTPPVSGEYTLEVSSPGIERKLKTSDHFIGAIGENIKATLKDKKRIKGKLIEADQDGFVVADQRYSYDSISKASVVFSWDK